MASNEITIRITPEGKVIFDMSRCTQEQIRLHREMAQETLGRIIAEGDAGDAMPPAGVLAEGEDQDRIKQRE